MKKIFFVICVMAISSLFSHDVLAKQTVSGTNIQIVQTLCQDSDLYAYVHLPKDKENNAFIVDSFIDNNFSYKQAEPITKIKNTADKISYLFLVDISTSMPSFKNNITEFITNFITSAGDNSSYAIATFGNQFELKNEFTNNPKEIKNQLATIQYDVKQTSLYSSLISAIDYYEAKKRSEGELYNIVVITDGIEADKDGATKGEVNKRIKATSILIHTFGFPTKSRNKEDIKVSEESLKILGSFARLSLGVYTVFGYDNKKESELALETTDFVNNLYQAKFEIHNLKSNNKSHSLKLRFAETGEKGSIYEAEGRFIISSPAGETPQIVTDTPNRINNNEDNNDNSNEDNNDNSNEENNDNGNEDSNDNGKGESKDDSNNESNDEINDVSKDDSNDTNSSKDAGASIVTNNVKPCKFSGITFMVFGMIFVLLVLLVSILILLLKRHKRTKIKSSNQGIYMKAEILSGKCKLNKNSYYLQDELIIGRNRSCALRLNNKDISKINSKIYIKDNIVYIEDANSTNGTSINNIKIYSPNKLRSGDVISIGSVKLVLKF